MSEFRGGELTFIEKKLLNRSTFFSLKGATPLLISYVSVNSAISFPADCKNLQDLNLSQCKSVCDDVIKELSVGCSSLLYVNISDTDISDASLRYISRYELVDPIL